MTNKLSAIKPELQVIEAITNAAPIKSPEARREVRRILQNLIDIELSVDRAEKYEAYK